MPTGYTARLEATGYDVMKWLKEDVVRAMGVCVVLRDDGNLSEEEIRKRLQENQKSPYRRDKITEAASRLSEFSNRNPADWEAAYDKARLQATAEFNARQIEFNEKKEKHIQAAQKVHALLNSARAGGYAEDSVVVGTLRFASSQLNEAFSFDYANGCYQPDILSQNQAEWRKKQTESAEWDFAYHTKELAREGSSDFDRAGMYDEFTKFVDDESASRSSASGVKE